MSQKPKVGLLWVEDNPESLADMIQLFQYNARKWFPGVNLEIFHAQNIGEALSYLEHSTPDIFFTDLAVPGHMTPEGHVGIQDFINRVIHANPSSFIAFLTGAEVQNERFESLPKRGIGVQDIRQLCERAIAHVEASRQSRKTVVPPLNRQELRRLGETAASHRRIFESHKRIPQNQIYPTPGKGRRPK